MESPWGFQEQKFGIQNSNRIPNSELLPLESPWQFHEQKFGIRNSTSHFDFFGQISQKGQWNSEFRTSVHGIAMAISRAEVQNSEFYWNSKFRTSAHGIPMAIPWAEVRNRHLHRQKFRPLVYIATTLLLGKILPFGRGFDERNENSPCNTYIPKESNQIWMSA